MANVSSGGAASDALAAAWAEVLSVNSTITSLNLESNGIQVRVFKEEFCSHNQSCLFNR
jgi:hypothetical protein